MKKVLYLVREIRSQVTSYILQTPFNWFKLNISMFCACLKIKNLFKFDKGI